MAKKEEKPQILLPVWDKGEPYFTFSEGLKRSEKPLKSNRPRRVMGGGNKPVYTAPSACRGLLNIYPNAISVGQPNAGSFFKSLGAIVIASIFVVVVFCAWMTCISFSSTPLFSVFLAVFGMSFCFFGVFIYRVTFKAYADAPVLFDRKNRQVTIVKFYWPRMFLLWKKKEKTTIFTIPWEEIKVRTYRGIAAVGGHTAHTSSFLSLLWGEKDNPTQFAGFVNIGQQEDWYENENLALWEHIRQYMEDDGPAIRPGDRMRPRERVPDLPPYIIEAAGGPALSPKEIRALQKPAEIAN